MKKISIEKLFVVLTLIFGCIFIYIIPPFQSPDEDSHFKKAYSMSRGNLYASTDGKIVGLNIPNSMNSYINTKLQMMGNRDKKFSYSELYYNQLLPGDYTSVSLIEVSTSTAIPIAHIVPAVGIVISKVLSRPIVSGSPNVSFMLYFARFFSLISYIIIGYLAIKITPVFKKSMFTILTIPMSIFLASMVTYDNLLIPITALTLASILKLIYDKKCKFNIKWMLLFVFVGYILYNLKKVYFPILLLLIFVPKEKFKNGTNKNKFISLIGLFLMIILISRFLAIFGPNFPTKKTTTLPNKQIDFILNHPFEYFNILKGNLKWQLPWQLYWMVGTFGLLDTYIPPLFMYMILMNLLMSFLTDGISEKFKTNYLQKIVAFGIIIVGLVLMYTGMYIYWTTNVYGASAIGGSEITGVQGRYFIPLLFTIPLIFSNNLFKNKKRILDFSNNYFQYSFIITIICLIVSLLVCLTRFWI